jgi:uncharacterized membrane protein YkvA (DUF1232 family)
MRALRVWTFLKTVGRDGLVLLHALRDAETPMPIRAAIVALAVYAVSPVDLLPDFAMLFGWADDLVLLMVGIPFLVKRLPPAVRVRAERAAGRFGPRRA